MAATELRLAAEKSACEDAKARERIETELARITRAREEAARTARQAIEVRMAAEKQFLEKAAELALSQRIAAEAAEAKAREAIELARLESARAKAEQGALAAIQEKLRAEEVAHAEAEKRAALEREASELATRRMAAESEARAAEEVRAEAERRALEAARRQREYAASTTEQADALREKCEREQEEAQLLANDLIERMKHKSEAVGEWRVRAEAVLAESPVPASKPGVFRRPLVTVLGGAAFVVGVAVAANFTMQGTQALPVPVSVAEVAPAGLQMSYQLSLPVQSGTSAGDAK